MALHMQQLWQNSVRVKSSVQSGKRETPQMTVEVASARCGGQVASTCSRWWEELNGIKGYLGGCINNDLCRERRRRGNPGDPISGWARRDGIAFAAWGCRVRSTLEGQCKVSAWDRLSLRIMRTEVAC